MNDAIASWIPDSTIEVKHRYLQLERHHINKSFPENGGWPAADHVTRSFAEGTALTPPPLELPPIEGHPSRPPKTEPLTHGSLSQDNLFNRHVLCSNKIGLSRVQ